jgi:hypothetical protein
MMSKGSMYWLKPFALLLALAVMAHANCAVSCVHTHTGKVLPPESQAQSPENCHQSKAPDKSDKNEGGSTCAHSQLSSGDRPTLTGQDSKPLPVLAAHVVFSLEVSNPPVVAEAYTLESYASAPPLSVLRI